MRLLHLGRKDQTTSTSPLSDDSSRLKVLAQTTAGNRVISAHGISTHVRFGSKADICAAKRHVRFTPESDRESGFPAKDHVCFTPESGHVQCNWDAR